MPNIEIDFELFVPSMSVFYSYFEILKEHKFIQDIEVVRSEDTHVLRVLRNEELSLF